MKVTNEAKIGVLVSVVMAALLLLTFKVGNFNFTKKGYTVTVQFIRIEGLEKNAPVRLNGLEVGSVKDVKILYEDDTKMEMTLLLEERAKLREGTKAFVKNMGLLGEKYIELSGGDRNAPFIGPGAVIVGQEPVDFEKLLAKGDVIADNLTEISQNLNQRLKNNGEALDSIIADLKVTMKNMSSISANVNERLAVNRQAIDDIIANLDSSSQNLEDLSADLKLNPWKLLYKAKDKSIK